MEQMISIIAAVAKNGVIGKGNDLPWGDIHNMPEDKEWFKKITLDKMILMGRNTYESIFVRLGRKLPRRKKVVVSQTALSVPGEDFKVFNDLDDALNKYKSEDLIIIGGASIYKQTIDKADKLYITHVDRDVEGDIYFPEVDWSKWQLVKEEKHNGFTFAEYVRR